MAELVVRVAIRGDMATYKWEGEQPLERDVTSSSRPPNSRKAAEEPTWILASGLRELGDVADFQFDSAELMNKRARLAKWDALNKAVEKLLVAALPKVKRVKLVPALLIFEVEEYSLSRIYTPPAGTQFVDLKKLESALRQVHGVVVHNVREKRVVVGLGEHLHWREPHVDVVLTLGRFCC